MDPVASVSGPPTRPFRTAMISAMMLIAISSGDRRASGPIYTIEEIL